MITLGWSRNLICFKNISTAFEFSWINAPFVSDSEKLDVVNIDETLELNRIESWKSIELNRQAKAECAAYESELANMKENLDRIKRTIVNYLDINECEPKDEQFHIQFFNLNATEADVKNGALKEQIEAERESLEKEFTNEKARIENIKHIMWDCFETKPQKLQGIFTDIFIQNFPLTDLDEKLGDETLLNKVLESQDLFHAVCELMPWIHPNIMMDSDVKWPIESQTTTKATDRFSLLAARIIDQQLTSKVNLDYNFFSILPTEQENVDIHDDTAVNAYSIKIYVSIKRDGNKCFSFFFFERYIFTW